MSSELASAAATSQLQRASQQYVDCRRKVNAKVEEVKSLEFEIQAIFERIAELQVTQNTKKSVGKLQITIAAVEGEAPVKDALIHVDLDPEYVEDGVAPEPVQKKQGEEDGEQSEKEDGNEQQEEKATEKQEQKQEEVHVEASKEEKRVISWNDADAFPKTFIFDPVQSREAVVTITVAGKNKNEDEEENEEPIKEIEFPISKLFTESLDQWFVVVEAEKEEGETEKVVTTTHTTTITEVVTETEDDEAVTEVEEEVIEEFLAKNEHEQAEEASATTATKPQALRIHIKAALDLSPIEKLNLTVIELTKQKQQAEAILSVLEREVTALRSRYERLTASQRAAANVSTVRNQGQSGAFLGKRSMAQRRAPKSSFERLKDSISSTFSRRKDNFISAGIFVGSVLLFHNKGENLLD